MYKDSAIIALVNKANHILVTLRKDGKYGLPGGGIESGETPLEAAIRELKEETDIEIDQNNIHANCLPIFVDMEDSSKGLHRVFCFYAYHESVSRNSFQSKVEKLTCEWIKLEKLADLDFTSFPRYNKRVYEIINPLQIRLLSED